MANDIRQMAADARKAARQLATTSNEIRNNALEAIAKTLEARRDDILAANEADIEAARKMVEAGELGQPLLKRLSLAGSKFDGTVAMVRSVASQPDPLNRTQTATELTDGLNLYRVSVPIGVIGVIFESRPDALVQIAALGLKSGNAVLLKGGREAAKTNAILAKVIAEAASQVEAIADGWIGLMESREDVGSLLAEDENVDLIIPRGSNEFVQYIMNNTRIPVMGHADGICHAYIDKNANLDKAVRVAVDSKTQYVAVCNAMETLLVHADIAEDFLNRAIPALLEKNVEIRADERARSIAPQADQIIPASDQDWATEYLDYILSIKIVDTVDQAIEHINHYGSHHTDAILTEDHDTAKHFLRSVDSACVFHNASTRFADGFRFGLGAEVGISTNRLHSRGPVGLEGLTIYKYIMEGDGHTVDDFEGNSPKPYSHKSISSTWNTQ